MYGYVGLCMAMYCYGSIFKVMYGYVDLCILMYDYVWLCRVTYSYNRVKCNLT